MNYSGSTTFDYSICREDKEIILSIEGSSYFTRGKLDAEPFDCYPDEGETEIISIIGPDGMSWEEDVSDEEREKILSLILEHVQDQDDPDEEDEEENDYDYDEYSD